MDWKKLKSGTDIRGTAIGENILLTDEAVTGAAKAFYAFVREKTGKNALRITVGHDSRISAERIKRAVIDALVSCGAEVLDFGLCSTPAMFMSTLQSTCDADGAVMITASHHPYDKNGLKFFLKTGGITGQELSHILSLAEQGNFMLTKQAGSVRKVHFLPEYAAILVELVRKRVGLEFPLQGLKVIVDAGNGAGGFFVDSVLKPLGADTEGSLYLNPDGYFPNHIPNPENAVAMQHISRAVIESDADFGIIFDTDVDRAAAVLKGGRELNRNKLIAMMSAIILEEQQGAVIVTDSVTNESLTSFIESKGGVHHRFKRGYRNVIDEAQRLCGEGKNAALAIETSGHAAFRENYFLDDGAYLIAMLLIELAKGRQRGDELQSLIADFVSPEEEAEIRFAIRCEDFAGYGRSVIESVADLLAQKEGWSSVPSHEGIRMHTDLYGGGSFVLRLSVHDPILPLNIESNLKGGCAEIAKDILSVINSFEKLDLQALKEYLGV
ncbi:MAG: phosphomannomutase/phosphoglucomutase [Clostridia bacterium]|nr:phosphomannomutase/phosphoglucomutase [Clostridia bacterium]